MTARIKVKWLSIQRKTIDPLDMPDGDLELWSIPDFDNGSPSITNRQSIGSSKKVVFPGDVLLSKIVPHIRRAWIVRESNLPQYASTEWLTFHSSKVRPEFLRYALLTDEFNRQMQLNSNGMGSLKRADPEKVGEQQINLPTIRKQKIIADFLDKRLVAIDAVLHQKSEQLKKISSYRQSLITRAVTKGKYSKGFDAVSYVPFSAIFSLRRGLNITRENYQEEGVPCLSYGDVHSRYLGFVDAEINPLPKVSDDFVLTNPRCLLKTGEFVFADTSEDYKGSGDCTCVMNSGDGIFAGYHTTVASPTKRNICSQYYGYYFLSDDFRDQVRKEVKGVKVFSITNTILNHAKVLFLPLKDQEEIARFLDVKCSTINKIEQKIYKEIEKLKEYRSSLISAAVTGQLAIDEEASA